MDDAGERILNLDAVLPASITVVATAGGARREWELTDAISTGTLLWGMAMDRAVLRIQRLAGLTDEGGVDLDADMDLDAMERAQADYERIVLNLCAEVFRKSYPEMTRGEVASLFAPDKQREIVQAFIALRSQSSPAKRSGGASAATTRRR